MDDDYLHLLPSIIEAIPKIVKMSKRGEVRSTYLLGGDIIVGVFDSKGNILDEIRIKPQR